MEKETLWQACLHTMIQQNFYQAYWRAFTLVQADGNDRREQAFRLRYQVYCADGRFGGAAADPAAIEKDAYDDRAIHHLLIHNESGEAAGTVRIMLPSVSRPLESFEMQALCPHPLLKNEDRVQHLCEISRLCMAPRFRRRPGDGRILPAYSEQEVGDDMNPVGKAVTRRSITYAPLGLMMAAFQTAMDKGILDCVSLIEPGDFRSMKRLGMTHKILGPRIDAHGSHQPVIYNIQNVLDGMETANPECWEIVSDRGRLSRRAHEIHIENWNHSIFEETARAGLFSRFL